MSVEKSGELAVKTNLNLIGEQKVPSRTMTADHLQTSLKNSINTIQRHEPENQFDKERHTINIKEKGTKKLTAEEIFNPVKNSDNQLADHLRDENASVDGEMKKKLTHDIVNQSVESKSNSKQKSVENLSNVDKDRARKQLSLDYLSDEA